MVVKIEFRFLFLAFSLYSTALLFVTLVAPLALQDTEVLVGAEFSEALDFIVPYDNVHELIFTVCGAQQIDCPVGHRQ